MGVGIRSALIKANDDKYIRILSRIFEILNESSNKVQADYIGKILNILKQKDYNKFRFLVNSIDMWGGSGAVWEVYIENKAMAREFEAEIVRLIDLMERTKVLCRGIKPIRKLFRKNLEQS